MSVTKVFLPALSAFVFATSASASLIFDSGVQFSAQGFGNAPRDLSVHANVDPQSGCVGIDSSGNLTFGSTACTPESSVHDANGQANSGGQEEPPLADNQKFGAPTAGSLGITSANQIAILFNSTEPAGNGANVLDLTLNFYTSAGVLLGAIDGGFDFLNTDVGNGSAGFTFVVSSDELAYVNSLLSPTVMFTLNATVGNTAGGPESFTVLNVGSAEVCTSPICFPQEQVPEPTSLALIGAALLSGVGLRLRRGRRSGQR